MRRFFDMDGGVMHALTRLADLAILNLIFLISCLPVITIGAACTALAYTTLKMKENEGYIVKTYFHAMKENLKQATVIWLIMLALLSLIGVDVWITRAMEGNMGFALRIGTFLCLLVWLITFFYVFVLQARFYNTVKATITNAFLLAIANFPRTLIMLVVLAAATVATFWNGATLWFGILIWLMLGFSTLSYINISLMYPVLKKLMPDSDESDISLIDK